MARGTFSKTGCSAWTDSAAEYVLGTAKNDIDKSESENDHAKIRGLTIVGDDRERQDDQQELPATTPRFED